MRELFFTQWRHSAEHFGNCIPEVRGSQQHVPNAVSGGMNEIPNLNRVHTTATVFRVNPRQPRVLSRPNDTKKPNLRSLLKQMPATVFRLAKS